MTEHDIKKNNIYNILHNKIIEIIANELTIRKIDHNNIPYTIKQINLFIDTNSNDIDNLIKKIIDVYENTDKSDELLNPKNDLIINHMYNYIKF